MEECGWPDDKHPLTRGDEESPCYRTPEDDDDEEKTHQVNEKEAHGIDNQQKWSAPKARGNSAVDANGTASANGDSRRIKSRSMHATGDRQLPRDVPYEQSRPEHRWAWQPRSSPTSNHGEAPKPLQSSCAGEELGQVEGSVDLQNEHKIMKKPNLLRTGDSPHEHFLEEDRRFSTDFRNPEINESLVGTLSAQEIRHPPASLPSLASGLSSLPPGIAWPPTSHLSLLSVTGDADQSEGGYDVEFVEDLGEKYRCSICLFVLKDPVQTECGHRFCKTCIESVMR